MTQLADLDRYPCIDNPVSCFMAGSPGAGKTEFSKRFLENFSAPIVRIDQDEVRDLIPGYSGSNSSIFNRGATKGVEILHDYALKKSQNFLLDGTMHDYEKACLNINRSLRKGRPVIVWYVYQDPVRAWEFVKKRERLEGRFVPPEVFIRSFLGAMEAANMVKDQFGSEVALHVVVKDFQQMNKEKISFNVTNIDSYLPRRYSEQELLQIAI